MMDAGRYQAQLPGLPNYRKMSNFGCNLYYLSSFPGVLRVLNVVLGAVNFGLWIPGYMHQFQGPIVNVGNGDTERGYGNGWKQEPLNELVMSLLVICWVTSTFFLLCLCIFKRAMEDWNRLNKFLHLVLAVVQTIAGVCAICGILYFNQHCCRATMDWVGVGLSFSVASGEGYYQRHCYCYLTRYRRRAINQSPVGDTELYNAAREGPPRVLVTPDQSWTFAAHHMNPHIAAVFTILTNVVVYLLAYKFSKPKK